jgi:hypothetical protein
MRRNLPRKNTAEAVKLRAELYHPAKCLQCPCHALAMLLSCSCPAGSKGIIMPYIASIMPCSCHALALQRSKGIIRHTRACDPTVDGSRWREIERYREIHNILYITRTKLCLYNTYTYFLYLSQSLSYYSRCFATPPWQCAASWTQLWPSPWQLWLVSDHASRPRAEPN